VRDRPVVAVPVVRFPLEIVVGQTQRQAAPDVCLPPERAGAHPGVLRSGVGMILLVDEDVLDVVGPAPPTDVGQDVLERAALGVRWGSDGVLVEREGMVSRWRVPPAGATV